MARSSSARRPSRSSRSAEKSMRAWSSAGGRRRLPTWSARSAFNGSSLRGSPCLTLGPILTACRGRESRGRPRPGRDKRRDAGMLRGMAAARSKRVRLAYGRSGLEVEVPADADVLEPRHLPGLDDEVAAIRRALREPAGSRPLRELVPRGASVGISVCDVTRPFPASRVLPVLLGELEHLDPARVTVFVATGTHRPCTAQELLQMLGEEVPRR